MIVKKVIRLEEIDSTNKYVKKHHLSLENGTVVIAKHQTAGYGRKQRTWYDKKNNNLTFSILLKLPLKSNLSLLTQVAAASVQRALLDYNVMAKIKWPNDIMINDKKVCGILVENILENDQAFVIIGIGVNVKSKEFDTEIKDKATSLFLETNIDISVEDVFVSILDKLNYFISGYMTNNFEFLDVCRNESYLINKYVYLDESTEELVKVIDIDDLGRLVIERNGNIEKYYGSEVSLNSVYSQGEKRNG